MDQILKWFGEERCRHNIDRARHFWAGEGRFVISLSTPQHRPRQDTPDEERYRIHLASLEVQARLPGLNIPSIFPDYGTTSTARYWGGKELVAEETGNPHIEPVAATIDEALDLKPLLVDDPRMDAARALRLYRRLCETLHTEHLWQRTPDLQGTLNTAGLIMDQTELLMGMRDEPEKVHQFVDRVSSFLVDLWKYLRAESGGRICGSIWPSVFFPQDLGVMITEDMMPLLSVELYREFGLPPLKKIANAMGGLVIHCCGRWGRHAQTLKESGVNIRAVEFHWPFTELKELEVLADKTVFIPYIALDQQTRFKSTVDYYRHLIEETDPKYRFWFACTEDNPETLEFVREHWN